jgi:branched-chain amino acid transport system ATP-binding protein
VSERNVNLFIENVDAGYGISQVLFDVTIDNHGGSIAILGRNGAGKSTLLKTIAGEITPYNGKIIFDGKNIASVTTDARARSGMAYVPQEDSVFLKLSVQENLLLGTSSSSNYLPSDMEMVLDFFPKLSQRLDQQAGTLSGGERKMLAISRALIARPKLIMLDEPTEGVWIGVIEEIADRLKQLSKEISIILVEQHIELAFEVCDYAFVMDRGKIPLKGKSKDVKKSTELMRHLAP